MPESATPATPEPVSQLDILQSIAATLAAVQGQARAGTDVGAALEQMTKTLSELAQRTRPENPEHNRISAYNPRGLRDAERPQLKCEMYWVGYPITPETQTDEEIEAMNRLEPGAYTVTKANGVTIPFTVEGRRKQNGALESLWVNFPCKGDQSTDHRSQVAYCREAMGEPMPSLESLMAEVTRLKASLAVATIGG